MLVVIGGGEIGCYHARQLRRGVERGQVAGPVVIVDRSPQARAVVEFDGDPLVKVVRAEWSDHLMKWLGEADGADFLVPAPFQPHLLWTWLASELNAVPTPAPAGWALPYEVEGGAASASSRPRDGAAPPPVSSPRTARFSTRRATGIWAMC
jgi:hypothetical protein